MMGWSPLDSYTHPDQITSYINHLRFFLIDPGDLTDYSLGHLPGDPGGAFFGLTCFYSGGTLSTCQITRVKIFWTDQFTS